MAAKAERNTTTFSRTILRGEPKLLRILTVWLHRNSIKVQFLQLRFCFLNKMHRIRRSSEFWCISIHNALDCAHISNIMMQRQSAHFFCVCSVLRFYYRKICLSQPMFIVMRNFQRSKINRAVILRY